MKNTLPVQKRTSKLVDRSKNTLRIGLLLISLAVGCMVAKGTIDSVKVYKNVNTPAMTEILNTIDGK